MNFVELVVVTGPLPQPCQKSRNGETFPSFRGSLRGKGLEDDVVVDTTVQEKNIHEQKKSNNNR